MIGRHVNVGEGLDEFQAVGHLALRFLEEALGYAWVRRAAEISGGHAEMEYGCCMLSLMGQRPDFKGHLDKVERGAAKNPLLARNLESLKKLYPPVLKYFEEREKGMGSGKGKE